LLSKLLSVAPTQPGKTGQRVLVRDPREIEINEKPTSTPQPVEVRSCNVLSWA
jgi:hypothetical protein